MFVHVCLLIYWGLIVRMTAMHLNTVWGWWNIPLHILRLAFRVSVRLLTEALSRRPHIKEMRLILAIIDQQLVTRGFIEQLRIMLLTIIWNRRRIAKRSVHCNVVIMLRMAFVLGQPLERGKVQLQIPELEETGEVFIRTRDHWGPPSGLSLVHYVLICISIRV